MTRISRAASMRSSIIDSFRRHKLLAIQSAGRPFTAVFPALELLERPPDLLRQDLAVTVMLDVLQNKPVLAPGVLRQNRVRARNPRRHERIVGCVDGQHGPGQPARRSIES